jgi:integrase
VRRIGITKTPFGWRALIRVKGTLYTKRFKPAATLTEMQDWRQATRVDALRKAARRANKRIAKGTFAEDVETYLKAVRAMPTFSWRQADLEAWIAVFGRRKRDTITSDEIRAVLHDWRLRGRRLVRWWCNLTTRKPERIAVGHGPLSESACNHRRTALMHLYAVLDGKAGVNPVRDVPRFREPDPEPRGIRLTTVTAILNAMPDSATKARCLVMAWTGLPHATLMQLTAESVRWDDGTLYVPRRRKGKGTKARVLPLLPQAVKALKMMERYDAWGPFSRDSLRRSLHRACEAAGVPPIRPYDLRHSFGTAAYEASGDIRAVQSLLDHSDVKLTARYTLGAVDGRVLATLAAMRKVATPVTTKAKRRKK